MSRKARRLPHHRLGLLAAGLMVASLVVAACGGGGSPIQTPAAPRPTSPPVEPPTFAPGAGPTGRIAYSGVDGNIYTIAANGADRRRVTSGGGIGEAPQEVAFRRTARTSFSWPTWSPDGARLAFSQATQSDRGDLTLSVIVADVQRGTLASIFTNPRDTGFPVASTPFIPHYLLWSPDGQYLSFLAGEDRSIKLFLARADRFRPVEPGIAGAPIYLSWAPDAKRFLVHQGDSLFLVDPSKGALPRPVAGKSNRYQVPGWSPDSQEIVFADDGLEGGAIVQAGADGGHRRALQPLRGNHAVLWAPSGNLLAVTGGRRNVGTYPGLVLVSADGQTRRTVTDGQVLAFFWSPDATKIAYVAENAARTGFDWWVHDVSRQRSRRLAGIQHSNDQAGALLFFDQYAQSHNPWSPDSRFLVVSGVPGQGADSQGATPQVLVLSAAAEAAPVAIADGTLAVWSPQP